jgi:outer membrane protein assembly factor BamB
MATQIVNDWPTFHGDNARTGFVSQSSITAASVANLKVLHTLSLGGSILSVPAIFDGHVYVGTANGVKRKNMVTANGGTFYKIELASGNIAASFAWDIYANAGDIHGFMGMGCTPAIENSRVYFSAFSGKLYCLDADTLHPIWVTDFRHSDHAHNQPISNLGLDPSYPQAEGWCSPLLIDGKIYLGIGEGENPDLYAFIYCIEAETGNVIWIFCTNQYEEGKENAPNVLPEDVVIAPLPKGFSTTNAKPLAKGCVVWSGISYDASLKRIFCATGNPQPDSKLPAKGYAYSVLSFDAQTGQLVGRLQIPAESSYRPSDIDIDFGTSPTLFTRQGRVTIGIGNKNGGFFLIDAETMKLLKWRQLLPYANDGSKLATVDPHGPDTSINPNPRISNEDSDKTDGENFHGTYSTAAIHPGSKRIFIGIVGNNYHFIAAGIDFTTTPFMRAMDWETLADAWELDQSDPRKYRVPTPPMYSHPGESGLSSPAVVHDVVFCSTSKVSLYAFAVADGKLLWSDDLGSQTLGYSGGYGYCLGPAIAGNYVVAGGLINGRDGGILRIYSLGQ